MTNGQEAIEQLERLKMMNRMRARTYYYKHRKEVIKLTGEAVKNKESIPCPCGGKYKHHFISVHKKTKKHVKYLSNLI